MILGILIMLHLEQNNVVKFDTWMWIFALLLVTSETLLNIVRLVN